MTKTCKKDNCPDFPNSGRLNFRRIYTIWFNFSFFNWSVINYVADQSDIDGDGIGDDCDDDKDDDGIGILQRNDNCTEKEARRVQPIYKKCIQNKNNCTQVRGDLWNVWSLIRERQRFGLISLTLFHFVGTFASFLFLLEFRQLSKEKK